jgi:hypothetical protein
MRAKTKPRPRKKRRPRAELKRYTVQELANNHSVTYLTTGQVAQLTTFSSRTVQKWCTAGLLDYIVIPATRVRRITRESFIRFAIEHKLLKRSEIQSLGCLGLPSWSKRFIPASWEAVQIVFTDSPFLFAQEWNKRQFGVVVLGTILGRTEIEQIAASLRQSTHPPRIIVVMSDDDPNPLPLEGAEIIRLHELAEALGRKELDG